MAFKYGMSKYIITFSMYVKPDIVVNSCYNSLWSVALPTHIVFNIQYPSHIQNIFSFLKIHCCLSWNVNSSFVKYHKAWIKVPINECNKIIEIAWKIQTKKVSNLYTWVKRPF